MSQNCQLTLIKSEKHEIKYGLERWAGFHTHIAKAEFCTNPVLTETTNCDMADVEPMLKKTSEEFCLFRKWNCTLTMDGSQFSLHVA